MSKQRSFAKVRRAPHSLTDGERLLYFQHETVGGCGDGARTDQGAAGLAVDGQGICRHRAQAGGCQAGRERGVSPAGGAKAPAAGDFRASLSRGIWRGGAGLRQFCRGRGGTGPGRRLGHHHPPRPHPLRRAPGRLWLRRAEAQVPDPTRSRRGARGVGTIRAGGGERRRRHPHHGPGRRRRLAARWQQVLHLQRLPGRHPGSHGLHRPSPGGGRGSPPSSSRPIPRAW